MPAHLWQLQEAKNRFSELVDEALAHGPQVVTRHGRKTVVVMAFEEHRRRSVRAKPLSRVFQDAPAGAADLKLERDRGLPRPPVEL